MKARDFDWSVIPPDPTAKQREPRIRISWPKKGGCKITLTKAAIRAIGAHTWVQIKYAPGVLGIVACNEGDPHATRIDSKHTIGATRLLRDVLRMSKGESFALETVIDDGFAIGSIPDELQQRIPVRRIA